MNQRLAGAPTKGGLRRGKGGGGHLSHSLPMSARASQQLGEPPPQGARGRSETCREATTGAPAYPCISPATPRGFNMKAGGVITPPPFGQEGGGGMHRPQRTRRTKHTLTQKGKKNKHEKTLINQVA